MTNLALAEQVGLSPSGCIRRVNQLESAGIITGYHATLSPDHVGLDLQVFLHVELLNNDRADVDAFNAFVKSRPEVVACYTITGESDYLLHVVTSDLRSYKDFLMDHLTTNPLIRSVNTSVVLSVEKQSGLLPLAHLQAE